METDSSVPSDKQPGGHELGVNANEIDFFSNILQLSLCVCLSLDSAFFFSEVVSLAGD